MVQEQKPGEPSLDAGEPQHSVRLVHSVLTPDPCRPRSFLLHVPPPEPADDDDRDGTVLSARRSRSAAVAPPEEAPTAGEPSEKPLSSSEQSLEHPDEHQVGLDTDRSFVLYPVGKPAFHVCPTCGGALNMRSLQRIRTRRTG